MEVFGQKMYCYPMNEHRQNTPSQVKRQLRQEAGFGCAICGHPFIQYHHIIPWSEEQHFRPEDMMVLCGQCHPLCTVGALTVVDQRKAKLRPKNIVDNELKGKLWVTTQELRVQLAGGTAIDTPTLLSLGGSSVLAARLDQADGRVLISAKIHGPEGDVIAELSDNEWSMKPDSVWDFEAFPRHATIRKNPSDIAFAVDTRGDVVNLRGKWFHNRLSVEFSPTEGRVGTNQFRGFTSVKNNTMIAVA